MGVWKIRSHVEATLGETFHTSVRETRHAGNFITFTKHLLDLLKKLKDQLNSNIRFRFDIRPKLKWKEIILLKH